MSGGLFFGINIALKGMMAQQSALNVTSHNIANANTPGYTRQRAYMETSLPISGLGAGQLGSGVEITDIRRIRDQFLDYQIRKESSEQGKWEVLNDFLKQVETVFMEPSETGFNDLMNQFWTGWQELSKNGEASPIRTNLKETAVSLTDLIRKIHGQLMDIKEDIKVSSGIKIDTVNSIAAQIAQLNDQIVNIKLVGEEPNDLLDQRDKLLDELASIGNVSITHLKQNGVVTGAIEVRIGDTVIVDASGAREIDSITLEEGELGGLQKLDEEGENIDTKTIQYYIDKLNTLAVGIAKAINDVHSEGLAMDGTTDIDFFVFKDQDGNPIDLSTVNWDNPFDSGLSAANIYVNPQIESDVSKIAAALPIPTAAYMESQSVLDEEENPNGSIKDLENQFGVTGDISFTINGQSFTISASGNTIYDLVDMINQESNTTGVVAEYDSDKNIFSLATTDKGDSAQINISGTFLTDDLELNTTSVSGDDDGLFLKGNGDNALRIYELRDAVFKYDPDTKTLSQDSAGGTTFDNFYKDMIAELGVASKEAERMVTNQGALVKQLENRRESISGVSLDEEMANMIRFQHAFQASARVISTMDELLDTVVNGLIR